jgi:hypothetical protein
VSPNKDGAKSNASVGGLQKNASQKSLGKADVAKSKDGSMSPDQKANKFAGLKNDFK